MASSATLQVNGDNLSIVDGGSVHKVNVQDCSLS